MAYSTITDITGVQQGARAGHQPPWLPHVQVIRPELLRQGFKLVLEKGLEVTDDVSLIEALGLPVRVTQVRALTALRCISAL